MDDQDSLDTSAVGISRCLRMLADEAVSLRLVECARAIQNAIRICESESSVQGLRPPPGSSARIN